MRKTSRLIGTILGVALLTAAVSACDEKEITDAISSATSTATETPADEQTPDDAEPIADGDDAWTGPGEDPATMEDDDTWTGPGEDPATMEDDDTQVDPNAYETLPGNCINDVPLPDMQHGVIDIEDLPGDECLITIDSRGDSLYMINDISEQLANLGFELTSGPSADSGEDAVNTVSYITGTHEVFVTVTQDGVSGVIIHYALTDPARGNG